MHEQLAELPRLLVAHLELTLSALLVGVCLSIPVGVLASRVRWLERIALSAAGIVQTIPSLALLALMVPLLGKLGARGIGFLPAFIALVLYSTLPILRNTVAGIKAVDPALVEAARGVGMSPLQQLWRVELPLALPVIAAGIRTATVWTVGAATLATPIGADSLGNYIFSGLQTRNIDAILVGCAGSAALALALDGLCRLLLVGPATRKRGNGRSLATVAVALCVAGLTLVGHARTSPRAVISVGAKTFTEQYVLSEILAQYLERTTDDEVKIRQSLGSSVIFDALKTGAIDVYVEYTGTIWTTIMKRSSPARDRSTMLAEIATDLRQRAGVVVAASLGFENTYALTMQRARASELGITKVSDLTLRAPELSIGGDYEFFARPEWAAMHEQYQLSFRERRAMDASLMYQALAEGAVDVISAFSTDGRIAALDLVVLSDDRHAIPPYDALILVGPELARNRPRVLASLERLGGCIDSPAMRRMNLAVDQSRRSARQVAAEFLGPLVASPQNLAR